MITKARELARQHGWFYVRQFENEANPDAHTATTAREILADFPEDGLDYWVSGFGTGGTLKGVARVLKKESPSTKVIVAEPDNSQIMASGIAQKRNDDGSASVGHPSFRPHLMQGWTPDFIPKLADDARASDYIDALQPVSGDAALQCAKALAQKEGIFCGISGGATFAAALEVAKSAPDGARILAMIPDTGERYMSTPLFADIKEEMSTEELELSASTPSARFDVAVSQPVVSANASEQARAWVEARINDANAPVTIFALEWCEFCWSVRNLMTEAGIEFRSIDLDAADFQKDNWGTDVRNALREHTGAPTIPQVFLGGQHLGGATETFDAFNDGRLANMLEKIEVPFDPAMTRDAYSFLPGWLHPR